MFNVINVLD